MPGVAKRFRRKLLCFKRDVKPTLYTAFWWCTSARAGGVGKPYADAGRLASAAPLPPRSPPLAWGALPPARLGTIRHGVSGALTLGAILQVTEDSRAPAELITSRASKTPSSESQVSGGGTQGGSRCGRNRPTWERLLGALVFGATRWLSPPISELDHVPPGGPGTLEQPPCAEAAGSGTRPGAGAGGAPASSPAWSRLSAGPSFRV